MFEFVRSALSVLFRHRSGLGISMAEFEQADPAIAK